MPYLNITSSNRENEVLLADSEINEPQNYYFRIATLEVKQFVKEYMDKNISVRDGVLLYTM